MSCVLRAAGKGFDVDAFLVDCELSPFSIWRRGEKRFPRAKPSETSGVRFQVSKAELSELSDQVADALVFLRTHRDMVAKLVAFAGVDGVVADFAVDSRPPHWASFVFEPSLLSALGQAGISLEVSVYPAAEEVVGEP